MEQEYYIYRITCIPTNKSYIGQTQKYKYKHGKPYKYGVTGRWCDHVSSSKRSTTPLHEAICEYGHGNFTHQVLENVTEQTADSREAYWISALQTSVPDGYNVATHSRCKHRMNTSITDIYPDVTSVEMKYIQRNGVNRIVYVYLQTPTERKRLTFGQSKNDTFEKAVAEAQQVVDIYLKQGAVLLQDKRSKFEGQQLKRIRIVPFNKTMIAVYITDQQNQQTRICFGGKHISYQEALNKANEFIRGLSSDCVENESATGGPFSG